MTANALNKDDNFKLTPNKASKVKSVQDSALVQASKQIRNNGKSFREIFKVVGGHVCIL